VVNAKYAETYRNPQIEKNVNKKDAKGSIRSIIFHEPLIIDDMEKRKPSKKNIIRFDKHCRKDCSHCKHYTY